MTTLPLDATLQPRGCAATRFASARAAMARHGGGVRLLADEHSPPASSTCNHP